MRQTVIRILVGIFCCIYATTIFAINASELPSPANVGQVPKQFRQPVNALPKTGGAPIQNEQPEQKVNDEAEKFKFEITAVNIVGNHIYPVSELQSIFNPFLKKEISLAKLQELVHEITKKYRADGYVLSRAILPPQTIKNGVVTVQVIEGYISKITVSGKIGKNKLLLEKMGQVILRSRPLQIHLLEHEMLLANDVPGLTVRAVITPSKETPGSADLTLAGELKRASAYFTYDNFGTRYLGPQQLTVGAYFNSILAAGDINSFKYATTTQPEELKFFEFIHSQPIGVNGTRWAIGTDYTETKPKFVLQPLYVTGRNSLTFFNISHPLLRTRETNVSLHATTNYQNVSSTILQTLLYYDRLRSLAIGGSFDTLDRWSGADTININLEKGFNILGAHKHLLQSRPQGLPNFFKLEAFASRTKYYTQRISLLLGFHGQYAFNPLLASEQFGFGGPDFGRGYDPSEIIGDDGVAGKVELRLDTMPERKFLKTVQFYAFYDVGVIWNRDAIALPAKQSAMSSGLGARMLFLPQVTGNFYIAKPMTKSVGVFTILNYGNHKEPRFYFQLALNVP